MESQNSSSPIEKDVPAAVKSEQNEADSTGPAIDCSSFASIVIVELDIEPERRHVVNEKAQKLAKALSQSVTSTLEIGELAYELALESDCSAEEVARVVCKAGGRKVLIGRSWMTRLIKQAALYREHPIEIYPVLHEIQDAERRTLMARIPAGKMRDEVFERGIIERKHFENHDRRDDFEKLLKRSGKEEIHIVNDSRVLLGKVVSLLNNRGSGEPPKTPLAQLSEDIEATAEELHALADRCRSQDVFPDFFDDGTCSLTYMAETILKKLRDSSELPI